jgi:thiol-disulfide isomerase/thioredoxin
MQIQKVLSKLFLIALLSLPGTIASPISPEAKFQAQTQNSAGQQSATELLKKVSEAYLNLKSYRFEIHVHTEIQSDSQRKSLETELDVSVDRPNKSRILMSGGLGELQSFADGSTTWLFLPELKQYRRVANSTGLEKKQPTRDRAATLAAMAAEIAGQYEKLSDRFPSAKVLRKESLTFAEKPVECWVIEANVDSKISEQKTLHTYWIDDNRFLVLKAVQLTHFEPIEGNAVETRTTTTLKHARINDPLPESWFVFSPPGDATEVVQFRFPRAGGMDLIGQEAADFRLNDLAGREVHLKSLRGQVILLNFWASWCGPCRLEMPVIERLHQEFKSKGLTVFGINDEGVDVIREYLSESEYTFSTLLDNEQKVARLYRVRGIPTMVVIDRDGMISHYRIGLSRETDLRTWLKTAGID